MLYRLKVWLLKRKLIHALWRRSWTGMGRRDTRKMLGALVAERVPGRSFADIGCLFGNHGEYTFHAEDAGASRIIGVDVYGPTPEFEDKRREKKSRVEFVLGDMASAQTIERIGAVDVVLCSGVLYHHPNPLDLLYALRRICGQTLILTTMTIPEMGGVPNAAVFYPMLSQRQRKLWDLRSCGVGYQVGIWDAYDPAQSFGNWFWGMTPSCVQSLLETAGFRIDRRIHNGFMQIFLCTSVPVSAGSAA